MGAATWKEHKRHKEFGKGYCWVPEGSRKTDCRNKQIPKWYYRTVKANQVTVNNVQKLITFGWCDISIRGQNFFQTSNYANWNQPKQFLHRIHREPLSWWIKKREYIGDANLIFQNLSLNCQFWTLKG